MLTRRSFFLAAGGVLIAGPPALVRAQVPLVHTLGGSAFGSYWRLTIPAGVPAEAAARAVEGVVASVDGAVSPYRPDSELARFNASRSTDWCPMSAATGSVLAETLAVAVRSGGAFDPTVGPIVGQYGFGPIQGSVGTFADIDLAGAAVRKRRPDLTLDLCGIAKGHALDRAAAALEAAGVGAFLLDLGGDVIARGLHPAGRAWQVGVERPAAGPPQIQRVVSLHDMALATSGIIPQSYTVDGRLYAHIVDPHSGEPVGRDLASVTVLAPTGAAADAWATALMASGFLGGYALAEREGIAALFLRPTEDAVAEHRSTAFLVLDA